MGNLFLFSTIQIFIYFVTARSHLRDSCGALRDRSPSSTINQSQCNWTLTTESGKLWGMCDRFAHCILIEIFADCYEKARLKASEKTGIKLNFFPKESPFTLAETLKNSFLNN